MAEAIKGTVVEWRQGLDLDVAIQAVEEPQALAAQLLPLVEARLARSDLTIADFRATATTESYIHLPSVFDAQVLTNTPLDFLPVPDCEGVVLGKAPPVPI